MKIGYNVCYCLLRENKDLIDVMSLKGKRTARRCVCIFIDILSIWITACVKCLEVHGDLVRKETSGVPSVKLFCLGFFAVPENDMNKLENPKNGPSVILVLGVPGSKNNWF